AEARAGSELGLQRSEQARGLDLLAPALAEDRADQGRCGGHVVARPRLCLVLRLLVVRVDAGDVGVDIREQAAALLVLLERVRARRYELLGRLAGHELAQ